MAHEPAMQVILLIVLAAGIVRGFSGFGSGMIIGPTTAALFSPITALAMITILDAAPALTLAWPTFRKVNWREVLPVIFGAAISLPLGIWLLKTGDPEMLRWFISASIVIAVIVLWSGWQYRGPRSAPTSLAVGSVSGFMSAAAALPGPAVLIYWLASTARAAAVRANMIHYLLITDVLLIAGYAIGGIYTLDSVQRGLLCLPAYLIGILLGARLFSHASEKVYRNVAFALILLAAVSSLPLLDGLLR